MKFIYLLILSFSAFAVHSQTCLRNEESGIAVGLGGGYASNQRVTGSYSVGTQLKNNWMSGKDHLSANLQIFSNTSMVGTPVIFEARAGHVFNNLIEIYGGYGYHMLKSDAASIKSSQLASSFKPAYGIMKRFDRSWWTVSAGVSGNIFSVQLGMLVIR